MGLAGVVLLFILAAAESAVGQEPVFFDLATSGDGATAHFSSPLLLRDRAPEPPSAAFGPRFRIYQIGTEGAAALHLERPILGPTPFSPHPFTNHFSLIRWQASHDGRVEAVTGARRCMGGGPECSSMTPLQTTVTGLAAAAAPFEIEGAGRLSGNGRYLLVRSDAPSGDACPYSIVDLRTRQQSRPSCPTPSPLRSPSAARTARVVADDGTAVANDLIFRAGTSTARLPAGAQEAVIDAAGQTIVYTQSEPEPNQRRSIRLYRVGQRGTAVDSLLAASPTADCHSPILSADGRRVLFVASTGGIGQLYTIDTGGGAPRQITNDSAGVLTAAMSDDGQVAWFFSAAARLYRANLETGIVEARLDSMPRLATNPGDRGRIVTPGSLFFLNGAGFADQTYRAEAFPLPRMLGGASVTINGVPAPLISVSPTQIVLQTPFATPLGEPRIEVQTSLPRAPFQLDLGLRLQAVPTFAALLPGGESVIHQDWSGPVTAASPARPGEILHLLGTGFGSVEQPPPDGAPAPANASARTVRPIACTAAEVLYSGLAPGMVGVYQLDLRIPLAAAPALAINCAAPSLVEGASAAPPPQQQQPQQQPSPQGGFGVTVPVAAP